MKLFRFLVYDAAFGVIRGGLRHTVASFGCGVVLFYLAASTGVFVGWGFRGVWAIELGLHCEVTKSGCV